MNLMIVTKFFYIIYKVLFIFLLATNKIERRLLESISNYFVIFETNKYKMLQLHYFV